MKLTDQDVLNIRHAHHDGDTATSLAVKYSVDVSTITKIVRGERRTSLGGPIVQPPPNRKRGQHWRSKLTPHQIVLMRLKSEAGATRAQLGQEFDVTASCIADIVNGRTYKDLPGPRSTKKTTRKHYRPRTELTNSEVQTIRARYADGTGTQNSLAAEYDVWPNTIGRIVRGESHMHVGGPITHKYKTQRTEDPQWQAKQLSP